MNWYTLSVYVPLKWPRFIYTHNRKRIAANYCQHILCVCSKDIVPICFWKCSDFATKNETLLGIKVICALSLLTFHLNASVRLSFIVMKIPFQYETEYENVLASIWSLQLPYSLTAGYLCPNLIWNPPKNWPLSKHNPLSQMTHGIPNFRFILLL